MFTLRVNGKIYTVRGVTITEYRVIRTPLNKGLATKITYYLFDGSVLSTYEIRFLVQVPQKELHYILANAVGNELSTTHPYRELHTRIQTPAKTDNYMLFIDGLTRLYVTQIKPTPTGVVLYLYDKPAIEVRLVSTPTELYQSYDLLDLAGKTRIPPERVALQLLIGNLRLDNSTHYLLKDTLNKYNIKYEVEML